MFEIIGLLLAFGILYILFKFVKTTTYLIINSIIGLIIFFILDMLGLHVKINLFSILIAAIAGIPGIILVTILHILGLAF